MATKRPAKLAIGKKNLTQTPVCPETGKNTTAVRVIRKDGSSGMHWVVIEDFRGSEQEEARFMRIG